jgi:quercetin dioxygenase-like cupin family protein
MALPALLALFSAAGAHAQGTAGPAIGQNMSEMKLSGFPGLPTCTTGAVLNGDPSKGPSIILAKAAAACVIPWHWHTPSEHLMLVSGVAKAEMKDGKSVTLRAGGFALMPSKHVHQFTCLEACALYIYSDAAFDIHYVDVQGKDILPEDALKAVKETPTAPPK